VRVTQLAHSGASHASSDLALGKELSRLLTAAVVNQEFCNLLLANPGMAVTIGYNGEPFDLAAEEQELIVSINATSLADFAKQLTKNGNGNGYNGHNYNGNGYRHKGYRNGSFK
jgi:short-subunit dehydrogenase